METRSSKGGGARPWLAPARLTEAEGELHRREEATSLLTASKDGDSPELGGVWMERERERERSPPGLFRRKRR